MEDNAGRGLKSRLGQILVDKKLISQGELEAAIREQAGSGRLLGEILADMQLITRAQVRGAMRRQRNLRLAAGLATVLLGPLQACAGTAAVAPSVAAARPFGDDTAQPVGSGALDRIVAGPVIDAPRQNASAGPVLGADVRAQALDDGNALAVFQHAVATAQAIGQGTRGPAAAGVRLDGDPARLLDPTAALAVDVNVRQVSVDPGTAYATVGKDGTVTLRVQSSAGAISVRNLQVNGHAGADAGGIGLHDIDVRRATVSIKPR